jgi:hypothetical protein
VTYSECLKVCEDFAPNFGNKDNKDNAPFHTSFSPRIFLPNATRLSSPIQPNFMFSRLKIKLKYRHFYSIEVIEAELLSMLNTLTKHDFQHACK